MGQRYLERGRIDDATIEFKKALILNPSNPGALAGLAAIRQDNIKETLSAYSLEDEKIKADRVRPPDSAPPFKVKKDIVSPVKPQIEKKRREDVSLNEGSLAAVRDSMRAELKKADKLLDEYSKKKVAAPLAEKRLPCVDKGAKSKKAVLPEKKTAVFRESDQAEQLEKARRLLDEYSGRKVFSQPDSALPAVKDRESSLETKIKKSFPVLAEQIPPVIREIPDKERLEQAARLLDEYNKKEIPQATALPEKKAELKQERQVVKDKVIPLADSSCAAKEKPGLTVGIDVLKKEEASLAGRELSLAAKEPKQKEKAAELLDSYPKEKKTPPVITDRKPDIKMQPLPAEKKRPSWDVATKGEVIAGLGVTSSDIIWNDANADKIGVPLEKNWRYLWGDLKHNTFDPKIYSRFSMDLEADLIESPWKWGMNITIDPWTFIGKADVRVESIGTGDFVDMELKYWSNTRRTINEVYRSYYGNIINLSEIKVIDNKTTFARPKGLTNWYTAFDDISPTEIKPMYRPLRKLWVDYNSDDYKLHVFPISDEYEALTSDDPLRLSNNHLYWEESPWFDEYEPSRIFYGTPNTLKKGRWIRRLSFFSKDSSFDYPHRLTFLRGLSFNSELSYDTSIEATAATPVSLWDDYETANSLPLAVRLKKYLTSDFTLGTIYTAKLGFNAGSLEAVNQVVGIDGEYKYSESGVLLSEVAFSDTKIEEAYGFDTSYDGFAFKTAVKDKLKDWDTELSFTHVEDDFYPALSNYRYTRTDRGYSQHITFEELDPDDEAVRLGDSVDRGRNVIAFKAGKEIIEDKLDTLVSIRNAHEDTGKYVETVSRAEATYKITPKMTSKFLAWYKDLPKTKAGVDPLIYAKTSYSLTDYFSDDDRFLLNEYVEEGEDPSIGTFSGGLRYDFNDQWSAEGVYERTNDPLDFPRGLLADTYVSNETIDGVLYDKVVPFLYDQSFFSLPPYEYYSIYKTRLIYKPTDPLELIFSWVINKNKYASGIDDNINHRGIEANYRPNEKLTFWAKYTYSKLIDVYQQQRDHRLVYDGHHNIFLGMRYDINKDESLNLMFGEFVNYDDPYFDSKWTLSALDTQHIVRFYYMKKWGGGE
ncbi:MAG: hypothetical protein ABH858_03290 [Candidatus Omnitrophota bacterium]